MVEVVDLSIVGEFRDDAPVVARVAQRHLVPSIWMQLIGAEFDPGAVGGV
jgi:hypothetical protein